MLKIELMNEIDDMLASSPLAPQIEAILVRHGMTNDDSDPYEGGYSTMSTNDVLHAYNEIMDLFKKKGMDVPAHTDRSQRTRLGRPVKSSKRITKYPKSRVTAGRLCYPWVMVGEFEDGFRKEQGGNDIGDCLSRLQDLESRHGELTWYGGLYDEDYVDGEYVGEENKVLSASSITASDDNIIQMLRDNAETMLDIYYIPEAEAEGFDTSNLTIGTPKITYQDEYMINADVPITGPNGVFNLQAELNDEDGDGNYVELLSTYDWGLAYGIIEELGDYHDFRKILNQA